MTNTKSSQSCRQETHLSTSADDLVALGQKIGNKLQPLLAKNHLAIELVGDVGTGKTTLTQGIARGLGIDSEITSPSFTICKKYAFPGGILSHYDFYRLPDPGIMADEIAEALSETGSLVVVEWGESVSNLLPENHIVISLTPTDDQARKITVSWPTTLVAN